MRRSAFLSILIVMVLAQAAMAAEAPLNLRISDGSNIGPAPEWNFTVPRGPSRTAGVAPLYVHFSAGLTPSSPGNMPFHDYEYVWDFGDPGNGTWGTSGRSKNVEKGAVAAHVYETPGTFTATLTVRNGDGVVDTERFTITVQDPNIVYAGTNTTCISDTRNNNFNACPAEANRVTTDNLGVLSSYTAAGRRVLLHRGSSWTVSSNIAFPSNTGPVHIGAYGACSSPDELGICSNAPIVTIRNVAQFLNADNKNDWRLLDIAFTGEKSSSASNIIGGLRGITNLLVFRIQSNGLNSPVGWSHWRLNDSDYIDHNAVVASKVSDFYSYGFYVGSERLALLGNVVQNSDITHICRVWQAYNSIIAHNSFSGASIGNTNGRQALKLHGSVPQGGAYQVGRQPVFVGTFSETGYDGLRNHTQFVVISNNVFGSSGPWPVSMGPQDAYIEEHVLDVVFEKNRVISDFGQVNHTNPTVAFRSAAKYLSVRNNIFNGAGSGGDYLGMHLVRGLAITSDWTPSGIRIFNNTIYNNSTGLHNIAQGIKVDAGVGDVSLKNNYVSFPNSVGPRIIISENTGGSVTRSNNAITDKPFFIDPDNTNPMLRNFRLTSSALDGIGKGVEVPVFDDFLGNMRSASSYDLGALCY